MPYIKVGEPLQIECRHFIDCVRARKQPVSDGQDGLRVVKVLDAAQRSLKLNGEPVKLALKRYASLSLDLDNQWSYMKTHGDAGWQSHPVLPRQPWCRASSSSSPRAGSRSPSSSSARTPRSRRTAPRSRAISAAGHEIGNHSFRHEPWLHLYNAGGARAGAAPGRGGDRGRDRRAAARLPRTGFSLSEGTLETLLRRGYDYDATVFPNLLNPLARAYFFSTSKLTRRGEGAAQRAVRHLEGRVPAGEAVPLEAAGRAAARDSGHDAAGVQGADAPVLPDLSREVLAPRGAHLPALRARRLPADGHAAFDPAAPARFHGPRGLSGARFLPRHGLAREQKLADRRRALRDPAGEPRVW